MRIISCHIENFGRLHSFDLKFDEGCMNIKGHNGWGKSTLAAFFRVMLYGFEGENKRGLLDNERKRWSPWQGGVYGGSLVFEYSGKKYLVTRIFGSKAMEDTFELRDLATNLVSNDFSSKLGEELFSVNAESFMRTVFIGQNDVISTTTDDINSKIGNIADSSSDLDCYEKAYASLSDLLNKNSPKRVTGSIYKLKSNVASLQTLVRDGSSIIDTMHKLDDLLNAKQDSLDELLSKRQELNKRYKEASEYKDVAAKLEVYEHILLDEKSKKDNADSLLAFFNGKVAKEDDINTQMENTKKENSLKETVNLYRFTEEEKENYDELKGLFDNNPTDMNETVEYIREWKEREERAQAELSRQADFKVLQAELENAKNNTKKIPGGAIAGMIMILVAMGLAATSIFVLPSINLIAISVAISAIILIVGIIICVLKIKKHIDENKEFLNIKTNDIAALQTVLLEDIKCRNDVDSRLTDYLSKYGMKFTEKDVLENLINLQKKYASFLSYNEKQAAYDDALFELNQLTNSIDTYLDNMNMKVDDGHQEILNEMLIKLRSYNEAKRIADRAFIAREKYELDNEVDRLKKIKCPKDMMNLKDISIELENVSVSIASLNEEIKDIRRQQEIMQEKKDAWEENRELLGQKEKELYEAEKSYKNMQYAKKYLGISKETMTAKYMEPLMKSFIKYYGAITGQDAKEYRLDANINLALEDKGILRDAGLLSTGYKDLVHFCLRLALIDAMYKEEKPVLIFDDPFVNLDKEKTEGAMLLLKMLAKNYQIFHFTCRD